MGAPSGFEAPGTEGEGEVFSGTVAGPLGAGALGGDPPALLSGMVGAGLGVPGALGGHDCAAVFKGIVGAGAGGEPPAADGGAGGAGVAEVGLGAVGAAGEDAGPLGAGAGGFVFKVTRTVSFLSGASDVFSIGVGGVLFSFSSAIIDCW